MNVQIIRTSSYSSNSYLINENILIDPGMNAERLIQKIEETTLPKNIDLIILTHCHFDHCAAAKSVSKTCNAQIAIHKDDVDALKNAEKSVSLIFSAQPPNIEPDITYTNNDLIPVSKTETLEVIHTPGHTPGGISLYESSTKSLFSGDIIFSDGGIGRTDFAGGSMQQLIQSIEKLTQLDITSLYPGHGEVIDDNANSQIQLSLQMAKTYQ